MGKRRSTLMAAVAALMVVSLSYVPSVYAQTEVMGWSNITGIRVDGELMEFESSLRVVDREWTAIQSTGKEKQDRPQYTRDGQSQIVRIAIDKIGFEQCVEDKKAGTAAVSVVMRADTARKTEGVYWAIELPAKRYANGNVQIGNSRIAIAELNPEAKPQKASIRRIQIDGTGRTLQLDFTSGVTAFVRKEAGAAAVLYVELAKGNVRKGQTSRLQLTLQTSGEIDKTPVAVAIDRYKPGRLFEGLGGNFRLQNPGVDPQVIDYCLNNLRVSWGRVEMPWRNWQPREDMDPIAEARAGRLDERVEAAMKMAQRLAAMGMPVIVSAWFPPEWAIDGDPAGYVRRGGVQAFRLDPNKQEKIYQSLTDYLFYLKQTYGVEAVMYSFNESDLGIDVLHTPQQHADFIKGLGAYMASRGLATKMLLGDNSDATTFDFILPAMNDPETHKYIGAVSFHSWRGCDDETLEKWGRASRQLNVPLLVGEGSTDAAAWVYPQIFGESTFALYEINLYTRLCAIAQPLSILQWQLTSDYSLLWGDGVFGSEGPLRPTQRFWNLKQLASTPEQSFALPFTCTKEEVNCAAFGNIAQGKYTVHLVNNGAARQATITGLPENLSEVKVYATNHEAAMAELSGVSVRNGVITCELPAVSFVSVMISGSK